MTRKNISEAIGGINTEYIEKAADYSAARKKNRPLWLKIGAIAACLCLIAAGFIAVSGLIKREEKPVLELESNGGAVFEAQKGVVIPKMKLSLAGEAEADMLAFFIYGGNCYLRYETFDDADIIGERLGSATGLIDEWTEKDGYVELAGSVKGDFYTVKGYDPSFMLCMKEETGGVSTYICNTGITLKYGSELYEDRLHLTGNYIRVSYETRESWNLSKYELYCLDDEKQSLIDLFIEQLNKAEFMPWSIVPEREGKTRDTIYETELYHMYLEMDNGMSLELRLYENGYVRFQGLLDVCVQVPQDCFDSLVSLMDSREGTRAVTGSNDISNSLDRCKNNPELGMYIPSYEPEALMPIIVEVHYYIDAHTGSEIGTKEIYIEYSCADAADMYYSLTITWENEYGRNGWAGPMIEGSELSMEKLSKYIKTKKSGNEIDVGVWYDDVSVVISAYGIDAESAYLILNSVKHPS